MRTTTRPHAQATAAAVTLACAALTVSGCGGQSQHQQAEKTAHSAVLSSTDVPAGMSKYHYAADELTVTLPAPSRSGKPRAAVKTVASVVDGLSRYPVTLTSSTDRDQHSTVTATWTAPAQPGDLDAAARAAQKAAPTAHVVQDHRTVVGVVWSAPTRKHGGTFAADLTSALVVAVGGRYAVTAADGTVTVTWAAPGLTVAGLKAVTAALAAQTHNDPTDVHVATLG